MSRTEGIILWHQCGECVTRPVLGMWLDQEHERGLRVPCSERAIWSSAPAGESIKTGRRHKHEKLVHIFSLAWFENFIFMNHNKEFIWVACAFSRFLKICMFGGEETNLLRTTIDTTFSSLWDNISVLFRASTQDWQCNVYMTWIRTRM